MLYLDQRPIQYSGLMYVFPCDQIVFMELFWPTSWRNSYKHEPFLWQSLKYCASTTKISFYDLQIMKLLHIWYSHSHPTHHNTPPFAKWKRFCNQKLNIMFCKQHLCKTSYRYIRTSILPMVTRSTTSCISVIMKGTNAHINIVLVAISAKWMFPRWKHTHHVWFTYAIHFKILMQDKKFIHLRS